MRVIQLKGLWYSLLVFFSIFSPAVKWVLRDRGQISVLTLILKRLGEGVNLTPPSGFSKSVSSKERKEPWVFVTYNIIISHIFSEHFIEIHQFFQNIWSFSMSILAIFINFHRFFWFFFLYILSTKKLTTSAYKRWCQHFFSPSTYFK